MKRLLILSILITATVGLFAQKGVTDKADRAYQAGKYFDAIDLYKYAFAKAKDKNKKNEIIFMVAECYRMLEDARQAEVWYRKAIKKGLPNPLATLYLADVLRSAGKYDEALIEYKNYKQLAPSDQRGNKGEESCSLALEWMANPTRYSVENMLYFNSKQSDYSPAYAKDDYKFVVFTSSREGVTGNKISGVTGEYYSDLFKTRVDRKGKWSEPVPVETTVNTEFDEGSPNTNVKCNTLYFTSFREDKDKNMVCKIFMAQKEGLEWGQAEEVKLVADTITVGHPAISPDELTLLFVADMRGGMGKKDIWKVTRASKTAEWTKPENLGPQINTPEDEMFPYIHPDGTLYFSSAGHPGMGGLDLFMATQAADGTWKVENMKYPMNSPSDDFGICFEAEMERGFFSSNRPGGKGGDDIYQFALPPIEFTLIGTVRNQKTENVIPGADVNLIGSDGTNISQKTETNGTFTFKLNPNTDYRIVTKRGGFLVAKGKETTKGMTSSKTFHIDVFMSPDDSRIDLPGIEYDFGKWDLRRESMESLEELVEILNDNPNITIEIGSHTDYRGSDQANMELSAKRAQSVVNFLITYGIDEERLSSKGYGETMPKEIDKALARKYPFLKEGDVLTESFINSLASDDEKEKCNQINRRTDFGLTGRDYVPKIKRRR
jgi:peptidoglycan-associated lipoprotein